MRTLQNCLALRLASLAALVCLAFGAIPALSQEAVTLVDFNHAWKYDQSGLELGTAWRTNDYNDSAWPSGRGLLGFEDTNPFPYPLSVRTPLTLSGSITSYYFRTTFQFSGETNNISLIASNFVDDGCVIYLNGLEGGRVRITNDYNAASYAQPFNTEGRIDPVIITNLSLLRQGENCLAVEVHQFLATSTDVLWGMKLVTVSTLPPDPTNPPPKLIIASQPQSQTVVQNAPFAFLVGVVGAPATYQWQYNGTNVANATSATYTNSSASFAVAGSYRVIITNASGSVTSEVAMLTVMPDLVGPKMISAVAGDGVSPHFIIVTWSEPLDLSPTAGTRDLRNYSVAVRGTTNTVAISNAFGLAIRLDTSDPDWGIGRDYVLTVSNLRDTRGNSVAPNSQIPVTWIVTNQLISSSTVWSFHNSASLEPDVADQDWFATNFVQSALWSSGHGTFYSDPAPSAPCFGTLESGIIHQREPVLFRTTFERPAGLGFSPSLNWRFNANDGAVFYLNGLEFYRTNMAPPGWPLDSSSRALANRYICSTNTFAFTNLLSGTNWIAAAIYEHHGGGDGRLYFGLELSIVQRITVPLPTDQAPELQINRLPSQDNRMLLSWSGNGFALEYTSHFSNNLSYPLGPWTEVTNMANPYTNAAVDPSRFFRLKK